MKVEKVYIKGLHPHLFRSGEICEVTGVKLVSLEDDLSPRLCYVVEFSDGAVDYWAISDDVHYEFGTINYFVNSKK